MTGSYRGAPKNPDQTPTDLVCPHCGGRVPLREPFPKVGEPVCDHAWVSMKNEVIVSGWMCKKCGEIKA